MAVPKLAENPPCYLLDPHNLPVPPEEAADRKVAARVAQKIGTSEMRLVDLVVCGSVAVNRVDFIVTPTRVIECGQPKRPM
jgi:5-formyltetrahydrofolate cyclo-ligase